MVDGKRRARRASRPASVTAVLLVSSMVASGCMMSPFDWRSVPGRGSAIQWNGYDNMPNRTVDLQASFPGSGSWTTLTTATSVTSSSGSWDGYNWYYWLKNGVVVPNNLWQAGHHGYHTKAKVRISGGGQEFMGCRSDFDDCWQDHQAGGMDEVYDECRSPESPVNNMKTDDYADCSYSHSPSYMNGPCKCCQDYYVCSGFGQSHLHGAYQCGGVCGLWWTCP